MCAFLSHVGTVSNRMNQKHHGCLDGAAVTYKGRGSGSKDRKSPVDRSLAIAIVADAVEDAVKRCGGTVKVDLKSPQVR